MLALHGSYVLSKRVVFQVHYVWQLPQESLFDWVGWADELGLFQLLVSLTGGRLCCLAVLGMLWVSLDPAAGRVVFGPCAGVHCSAWPHTVCVRMSKQQTVRASLCVGVAVCGSLPTSFAVCVSWFGAFPG